MPLRTSAQTSPSAPQPPPDGVDHEARVGRGAALLTAAKIWFIASGYAIEFTLPRVFAGATDKLQGKELYGAYGFVTGLVAIFTALVYQGTSQAVARFVGRAPEELGAVRRAAFRLQGWLVGGLALALALLAPWIADAVYHQPALAAPIRYASVVLLAFGFYAVTMGTLTGRQLFKRQALIDVAYSTLKVTCIVGSAIALGRILGWVESAMAGFALASVLVLAVSLILAPRAQARGSLPIRELLRFQLFTMAFNLGVTLVARLDLQMLQAFLGDQARSGDYKAGQAIAALPYQAVFAITFVLFPLASGAAARDPDRIRTYARESTRYALMIAALVALGFAGAPRAAVTLLYPAEYASAGPAMRVLVLGYLAFSVFYIMAAVLTAAGRPQVSLALVAVVVALQSVGGALLIPRFGGVGIAAATAVAMAVGFVGAHLALVRWYGAGVDFGMALRILAPAAAVAAGLNFLLEPRSHAVVTVVAFVVAGIAFVALLFLTGALGRKDADRVRRIFGRGSQHA